MALSTNGVYLATAIANNIHIWSTDTRRIVLSMYVYMQLFVHRTEAVSRPTESPFIRRLAFAPKENLIAYVDDDGWYGQIADPIPSTHPSPVKSAITTRASATVPVTRPSNDLFDEPSDNVSDLDDHAQQWENMDDTHETTTTGHEEEGNDDYHEPYSLRATGGHNLLS